MRSPLLPHIHYHLLRPVCVEGEVVVLSPWHQICYLPPVGRFIPAGYTSLHVLCIFQQFNFFVQKMSVVYAVGFEIYQAYHCSAKGSVQYLLRQLYYRLLKAKSPLHHIPFKDQVTTLMFITQTIAVNQIMNRFEYWQDSNSVTTVTDTPAYKKDN